MRQELKLLRELMEEKGWDYFYIPSADFHCSEYVPAYFRLREKVSGFTGSNGDLLVGKDIAYLWTDGRYYLQAERELEGSGIALKKIGIDEPLLKYLRKRVNIDQVIACDFRCVSDRFARQLTDIAQLQHFHLQSLSSFKVADFPQEPVFHLGLEYSGASVREKLEPVFTYLRTHNFQYHLLNTLDDINYLFNIRGRDIQYTPYVVAYALIYHQKAVLYLHLRKLSADTILFLEEQGVELKEYDELDTDLSALTGYGVGDLGRLNYHLTRNLKIVDEVSIVQKMKAVKNPVELENTIRIHQYDGVAVFRLLAYIKKQASKIVFGEVKVGELSTEYRQAFSDFLEPSFAPIVGFQEHGAVIHYSATPETEKVITGNGLLLVDSGGQYWGGTTDITRTISLGEVSQEEKEAYTRVVKGVINLSRVKFLYGCNGANLDILARQSIWEQHLDYRTGTGHGVSYMGGVHEGPNNFHWSRSGCVIEEGMIYSNEPGIYRDRQYGIRIENEMVVVREATNEYGTFMGFQTITYCPIDLDPLVVEMLTHEEKTWLNNYHQEVYNVLSPYLSEDEKTYLTYATRTI